MVKVVDKRNSREFPLCSLDMVDGKAYESDQGEIVIANQMDNIRAFSICGKIIIRNSNIKMFREVSMTITIE